MYFALRLTSSILKWMWEICAAFKSLWFKGILGMGNSIDKKTNFFDFSRFDEKYWAQKFPFPLTLANNMIWVCFFFHTFDFISIKKCNKYQVELHREVSELKYSHTQRGKKTADKVNELKIAKKKHAKFYFKWNSIMGTTKAGKRILYNQEVAVK